MELFDNNSQNMHKILRHCKMCLLFLQFSSLILLWCCEVTLLNRTLKAWRTLTRPLTSDDLLLPWYGRNATLWLRGSGRAWGTAAVVGRCWPRGLSVAEPACIGLSPADSTWKQWFEMVVNEKNPLFVAALLGAARAAAAFGTRGCKVVPPLLTHILA